MILTSFSQTAFKESFLAVIKHWDTNFITHYKAPNYIHYSLALALEFSKYIGNDFQELYEHMPVSHCQDFLILVYPLKKEKLNTKIPLRIANCFINNTTFKSHL